MPLIIILVIICVVMLAWPNKTVSQTLDHGPKDAAGCGATILWLLAAGLFMVGLMGLVSLAGH